MTHKIDAQEISKSLVGNDGKKTRGLVPSTYLLEKLADKMMHCPVARQARTLSVNCWRGVASPCICLQPALLSSGAGISNETVNKITWCLLWGGERLGHEICGFDFQGKIGFNNHNKYKNLFNVPGLGVLFHTILLRCLMGNHSVDYG